jgi:putative NIF3 family GTP cyclohydrolase 1 type 2
MSNNQRRQFLVDSVKILGSGILLSAPFAVNASPEKTWTVGEIMDLFIKQIPGAPFPNTVDTLKSGSRDNEVHGIVTTMFATVAVIKKAMSVGANFIIAHEPTFYNHRDETDWLIDDKVYKYKSAWLKDNNITVWRNHDYVHSVRPDGVMKGVIDQLEWQKYAPADLKGIINLPSTTVGDLISLVKNKLGISMVRYIGDVRQSCSKILVLPGAAGGQNQIKAIGSLNPDVVMVGELSEWETAEYVRDARASGSNVSLIVMGHAPSEEPGSTFMADWLRANVPGVDVTHIPAGNPLQFG